FLAFDETLGEGGKASHGDVGRHGCLLNDCRENQLAADLSRPASPAEPPVSKVTLTAMSGRMRGSFTLRPTRTLTVAFSRLAVGPTAITGAGRVQPGWASSPASTGFPACTRPMKASFTSTSTSIESMSTRVQMPVRVKPPTESGEIISPGWALRSTTTP